MIELFAFVRYMEIVFHIAMLVGVAMVACGIGILAYRLYKIMRQ